jgi:hypothetical protein
MAFKFVERSEEESRKYAESVNADLSTETLERTLRREGLDGRITVSELRNLIYHCCLSGMIFVEGE